MRSTLALLATVLVTLGAGSCGGTSTSATHPSSSAAATTTTASDLSTEPNLTKADADKDNDVGAPADDTSNDRLLEGAKAASASDRRAIIALIKRYYTVALAEEGATACAMIYSTLSESVPEDYGSFAGPPYMRGTTCPAILTLLFKHFHSLLAAQLPRLEVTHVLLVEHHGLAVLRFGTKLPERRIAVAREGHTWRLAALLDSELP